MSGLRIEGPCPAGFNWIQVIAYELRGSVTGKPSRFPTGQGGPSASHPSRPFPTTSALWCTEGPMMSLDWRDPILLKNYRLAPKGAGIYAIGEPIDQGKPVEACNDYDDYE